MAMRRGVKWVPMDNPVVEPERIESIEVEGIPICYDPNAADRGGFARGVAISKWIVVGRRWTQASSAAEGGGAVARGAPLPGLPQGNTLPAGPDRVDAVRLGRRAPARARRRSLRRIERLRG